MITFIKRLSLPVCATAFIALSAMPAMAQDSVADEGLFPPQITSSTAEYELPPGADTHPMMRLTPEKSEIINLDTDVKSLIIGNPLHLNVIMDTTRRLVLVPRSPGATSFTAIDENGKIVMQRHVIVNGPDEKYVRIRRSCDATRTSGQSASNCQSMSMYYCPEGLCHQVNMVTSTTSVSTSGNKVISPAKAGGGEGTGGLGKTDIGTLNENFNEGTGTNPFDLLMRALQNTNQGEQPAEAE